MSRRALIAGLGGTMSRGMDVKTEARGEMRRPGSIEVVATGRSGPLAPSDSDRIPLADGGVSVLVMVGDDRGPAVSS